MSASSILTGAVVRPRHGGPAVEALGVRDGVVVACGTVEGVRAELPGADELVLGRGAVLPAFVDAHQHAFLVAIDPTTDRLHRVAHDIPDLLARLRELVSAEPAGSGWLRFHGYEPLHLAERRSPTAAELDSVCPDRPLHVVSRTYHESSVNSAGLAALGIGRGTREPHGGRIVRDRRGVPTGVLLESESFRAEAASRRDDGTWRERAAAYAKTVLAAGITRIGDAAVPADLADEFVTVMGEAGVVVEPLLVGNRIDEPAFAAGRTAKVLADGGEYCDFCFTGRQVARLFAQSLRATFTQDGDLVRALARRTGTPRRGTDGLWHAGIRVTGGPGLQQHLRSAASAGSGLAVHAVGNGAVADVVRLLRADPGLLRAVPVRVEHAMVVDEELCRQLGDLGVPVVAQPGFLSTAGYELEASPVPEPLELMPFRSLLDADASLAFTSDHPATPLDPWRWVADAEHRLDGHGLLRRPHQRITRAEALRAATLGGAHALGVDAGALEAGAVADLIWVDRDPYEVDDVAAVRTLATWSAGVPVHASREVAGLLAGG